MSATREAFPHDVDLGPLMSDAEISLQLSNAREHPAVRAMLQHLRTKAASLGREGRTVPAAVDPGDWRSFHDGGEDALDAAFWEFIAMRKTELDKELEEGEETGDGDGVD